MADRYSYDAHEIYKMREFVYRMAQRKLKAEGYEISKDTNLEALVFGVQALTESMLQSYIMVGVHYDELVKEYNIISHEGIG